MGVVESYMVENCCWAKLDALRYLWILPPLYLGAILYNTSSIVCLALHFTIGLVMCWLCRLVAALLLSQVVLLLLLLLLW